LRAASARTFRQLPSATLCACGNCSHLLDNAVKFTERVGHSLPPAARRRWFPARVEVGDAGIGIQWKSARSSILPPVGGGLAIYSASLGQRCRETSS
jgi:hypothetical protein